MFDDHFTPMNYEVEDVNYEDDDMNYEENELDTIYEEQTCNEGDSPSEYKKTLLISEIVSIGTSGF